MAATVFARQRAPGLDRCAYSGGPAPEVRGRLFVSLAGPWWLEGEACRSLEVRRRGGLCECPTHGWGLRRGRVHSARLGTYLCGRGDPTPSGTGIRSPTAWAVPGWSGPHPAAWNVPRRRLGCGRPWSPRKRAIRASPAGVRRGVARESGWMTWDASGQDPHKRPMGDKPDLFLVHLRSVQGSGILCGNRSTSYCGRRISDRSGRPSVAVHQSNR